jgi:serralysin
MTSTERTAIKQALQAYANVAKITFTEVSTYAAADLVELVYFGADSNALGAHETPEQALFSDGKAWGAFNFNGVGWDSDGLKKGGFGFDTILHELGHALGLAHPHDDGGGSTVFPGVTPGDSADKGSNNLNQGMFTVMTYNHGWETGLGLPGTTDFGWVSSPMAFDIAAIQDLYGANTNYKDSSTTYRLGHVSGQPNDLSCIWDTGGTDTFRYDGSYAAKIDLREATLKNEAGGGGFVSYVKGAPTSKADHWNAFTIAKGVTIENAIGGKGNDVITGNQHANDLTGGLGGDTLEGGGGNDDFIFRSISESKVGSNRDTISSFSRGKDDIDLSDIDAKSGVSGNNAFKWIGTQGFHDVKGELRYTDQGSKCLVQGDINGNGKADFEILVKVGSLGSGDFLL